MKSTSNFSLKQILHTTESGIDGSCRFTRIIVTGSTKSGNVLLSTDVSKFLYIKKEKKNYKQYYIKRMSAQIQKQIPELEI